MDIVSSYKWDQLIGVMAFVVTLGIDFKLVPVYRMEERGFNLVVEKRFVNNLQRCLQSMEQQGLL